jgi:N-methylhydantoinase B
MQLDPITFEVIRNALSYTAEEMGIALRNSAYSHNIKERMDHSCALFDLRGNLLAQAEHIPLHLGSLPWGVKNVLRYFQDDWKEKDIVIVNDPYITGTHLNDLTLMKPIFLDGEPVCFSVNKAHHVDVGGQTPGSISCNAGSLFQEGEIIPPVKLVKKGYLDQNVLKDFLLKVRNPLINQGDLRAQIAAASMGERRVIELVKRYGTHILFSAFEDIISSGEKRMRKKLESFPGGVYSSEDCLEGIRSPDELTWIQASVKRDNNVLSIDFSGTESQVETPFNAVFGVTLSATYFAIKSILDPESPMSEGALRPIMVFAPEGSLVNPKRPAPVSGGNLETAQRIADVVFRALAKALPDRVPAASNGSMNNVMVGGYDTERKRQWIYYETIGGGSGGRPGKDGVDGIHCCMTNTMNTPVEALEQYYPVVFEQYEFRPGTYGDGKWRGGCGIKRSWTLLGESAEVTVIGERNKIPPWGLAGGQSGGVSKYWVLRNDGRKEILQSKAMLILKKGDMLNIETPGGGGYGIPDRRKKPVKLSSN